MAGIVRSNVKDLKIYVPGKPIEEVQRELGLEDIIKLASNENPLGPSENAVKAMQEAIKNVNLYPDGNAFYLKEALARHWQVDRDQILIGNGSDEIVMLIALTFINPGDEAIMATPSFPRYEPVVKLMNGVCHEVPLKEYRHDLEAMAGYINDRTKLIFLCNPNNPTGTIVTRQEVDAFIKMVPEHTLVVFDEAYFEFVKNPDYPDGLDYLAQGRKVIVLRTFSKIYGLAGLRVGYAISDPEFINYLNRVRPPFNVDSLAQAAALASLGDESYVSKVVEVNERGKEYFYREFKEMGLRYIPTEANFMMVDVKKDSVAVFKELLKKGIIVRSGDIFGMPTWIRVTMGTPEQNLKFIKALRETLS